MATVRDELMALASEQGVEFSQLDPADLEMARCPLCQKLHDGEGWRAITPQGVSAGICSECWEKGSAQEVARHTHATHWEFKAPVKPLEYRP